jgi:hypothetical protein
MPDTAIDAVLDQIDTGTCTPIMEVEESKPGSSDKPIATPSIVPIPPPNVPITLDDLAFCVRLLARRAERLQRKGVPC